MKRCNDLSADIESKKKQKKSISITKKPNLFDKAFNPSEEKVNLINYAEDKVNMINNGEEKLNLYNQINYEDEKFNFYRCQQKNKSSDDKKGKGVVELKDVDQAMGTEILMDILKWLPVRSLLRFKCVSKFWNALISEPYFKMKQLSHAKNDKNSQRFVTSEIYPKGMYISNVLLSFIVGVRSAE